MQIFSQRSRLLESLNRFAGNLPSLLNSTNFYFLDACLLSLFFNSLCSYQKKFYHIWNCFNFLMPLKYSLRTCDAKQGTPLPLYPQPQTNTMLKYGDDQIFSLFDSLLRSIYREFFFLLYIPDECNGSQFSLLIFRILLSFLLSFYSYLLFWLESMLLSLATHISLSNLLCLLSDLCPTSGSVLLFSVGSYLEGFRHSGMVTISRTDET